MSYRFMRMLIFFDLPTTTQIDKKNYRKFRQFLISEGFVMVQYSMYSKLVLNSTASKLLLTRIKKNSPSDGVVQVLTITEKQYASMEYLIGSPQDRVEESDRRVLIL